MKNFKIQVYGHITDNFPNNIEWAAVAYEDEFAFTEKLKGKLLEDAPDLCLEVHTRPYYAHLMPKDVPKAVYFCNFPGGYFHNEALLDLYDFIFYDNVIGDNYARFHPKCRLLPPWMPDAFLFGAKRDKSENTDYCLGIEPPPAWGTFRDFSKVRRELCHYGSLNGRWFLGDPEPGGMPLFLGICFKVDSVYVSHDSPVQDLLRNIGVGLFKHHDRAFNIVEDPKPKVFRQHKVKAEYLFGRRIEQIASFCFRE